MKKHLFIKQFGFSLIEIMVAAGILSFVGLAVTTTLTDVVKMQNSTIAKDESNEFSAALARFLFTETTCSQSLGGQRFPLNNQRSLQMPNYIGYGADSATDVGVGFAVGGKLQVTKLDLLDKGMAPVSMLFEGQSALRVLGQVNLETQQTIAGKSTVNPSRSFELPLLINPANNQIIKCLSSSSVRDACVAMGTRLDPVTGLCRPESQCTFEGAYTTHNCNPAPVTRPCPADIPNEITGRATCPSGAGTSRQTGSFSTSFTETVAKKSTQVVNVGARYFLCLRCE